MYKVDTSENSIKIQCGASFEEAERMCKDVNGFIRKNDILKEYEFAISLGLREMVNNALDYGSDSEEANVIKMQLLYNNEKLKIVMKDEGQGFDWRKRQLKIEIENIDPLEVGGKGLYLLEKYFDSMYFNDKGNQITVEKNIQDKDKT